MGVVRKRTTDHSQSIARSMQGGNGPAAGGDDDDTNNSSDQCQLTKDLRILF